MTETIRITENFQAENGFSFWKGETFISCMTSGDDVITQEWYDEHGTEVKTHGEYVWIPGGTFEVVR